jgi:hypothetical protein
LKFRFLLILFTLFYFQLFATDSLVLIRTISTKSRLLSTDPLGNIYLVKENNTLLRLNERGDSIGIFNEIKKGKISHIDATNPLRILLFFSDYNQIVVLNNMLTIKNVLRLNSIGLNNVACIANSVDGNIWVYDPVLASLIKVDEQLKIIQTTNLRNVEENSISPGDMIEQDRSLFIADTIDGIRKFDQFGFFNTTFALKTNNIQTFNSFLVYYSSPFLYSYNTKSFTEKKILLPQPENILAVRVERNRLFILREDQLDIYDLKE